MQPARPRAKPIRRHFGNVMNGVVKKPARLSPIADLA